MAGLWVGTLTEPTDTSAVELQLTDASGSISGSLDIGPGDVYQLVGTRSGRAVSLRIAFTGVDSATFTGSALGDEMSGTLTYQALSGTVAVTRQ